MSILKSSAENLTLNADGSGNDIIFQSNGSNVATLDQAGLFTATTFAGSGASLTGIATPITALNNATANELVTVGGTTTELDAETNLTFDGTDLTLGTGDIVFATAGKGICLGVTSNVDANTLDDYEEGSWTPVPLFGGASGPSGTYNGTYVKIGRHVTIYYRLQVATTLGSNTGAFTCTGIPFNPADANKICSGFGYMHRIANTHEQIYCYMGTGLIGFQETGVSSNNAHAIDNTDFTTTTVIMGAIIYETDS